MVVIPDQREGMETLNLQYVGMNKNDDLRMNVGMLILEFRIFSLAVLGTLSGINCL